ncbi:hypothetical protein LZC95_29475 [Pendulispora brunnea]|uniref:SMP-30/Gluconolactonase/LRE-like region domain-containing protein n=1 Tax=Pendulispora brunnea TaxID=2905690 RepID=A0ABZ2K0L8_9BACT
MMVSVRKMALAGVVVASMLSCTPSVRTPAAAPTKEEAYAQRLERRVAAAPEDAGIRYCLCSAYDDAGKVNEALACLEVLDKRGWPVSIVPRDFRKSSQRPEFDALLRHSDERVLHVNRSRLAFTAPGELVTENVAFDPKSGAFFLGSIRLRKIVRVSGGQVQDFPAGNIQPPLLSVVGMKVDAERRTLWAASEFSHGPEAGRSELLLFHVDTGELLKRFEVRDGKPHLFNDVVIASNEDVFMTDSVGGGVYRLSGRRTLEPFVPAGTFDYPNGVALSADEKKLFVAFDVGIAVVDIASGAVAELRNDTPLSMAGVDGLYFHRGGLVAVQNGTGRGRVLRLTLDGTGQRVTHVDVLESGNPDFQRPDTAAPTTGVLVGDQFHYVANYLPHSFELKSKPTEDVRILSLDLPH